MAGRKLIKESEDIRVNTYGGFVFFLRHKDKTEKIYGWDKFVAALKQKLEAKAAGG